jgi:putative tryptophan/tyrosine transport system substrate-binding protein
MSTLRGRQSRDGVADCTATIDRAIQGHALTRREAAIALGAFGIASFAAHAQPARKLHRLGFLGVSSAADYAPFLAAFLQGLRELGYEDGRNIVIEYRWADGREERLAELAVQLVRLNPDVIVSHATGVSAAQGATSTVPIVMGVSSDPVGLGLIRSLAQPGGNTTGVASQMVDLAAKRLELLKEIAPKLKVVAVLSQLSNPGAQRGLSETELAAGRLGVRVLSFPVEAEPAALESVFAAIIRARPDGLIVQPYPFTAAQNAQIAAFATSNRLPAMGGARQFVVEGGLISYGGDFVEGWRVAARYVDKILKGARPADLPVEQPTRFELVVNLKTARTLGIRIPQAVLVRADRLIE